MVILAWTRDEIPSCICGTTILPVYYYDDNLCEWCDREIEWHILMLIVLIAPETAQRFLWHERSTRED